MRDALHSKSGSASSRAVHGAVAPVLAGLVLAGLAACGGGGDAQPAASINAREQASTAAEQTIYQFRTQSEVVRASYYEQTNECDEIQLDVFASAELTGTGGAPAAQSWVFAQLFSLNGCAGTFTQTTGLTYTDAVRIRKDLRQAATAATIDMFDESGAPTGTLSVDLSWIGGDELLLTNSRYVESSPLLRAVFTGLTRLRESDSIAGSLVLDGAELLAADRPALSRLSSGLLFSSRSGQVTLVRAQP